MNCDMHTVSGQYFNTFNTITAACAKDVLEEALLLCGDFNDMLSKTIEGSDVWRINHAQGAPVCVSHHTAEILQMALTMHRLSGGVYNIAVGGAAYYSLINRVDIAVFPVERIKAPKNDRCF